MSYLDLTQNPPRNMDKNHPLLRKNKAMQKAFFLAAALCVPLALIFPVRFSGSVNFEGRIMIGLAVGLLVLAMAFSMKLNSKKSSTVLREGIHIQGALHSIDTSSTYITMNLSYKDNSGNIYKGNALIMGNNELVEKQAGDTIDILYLPNRPSRFAVYIDNIGVSVSESKKQIS